MKKFLCLLLATACTFGCIFSLTACGDKEKEPAPTPTSDFVEDL